MLYSGKDLRKLIIPLIIEQILAIALSTCAIEIFLALCDTPFLYLSRGESKLLSKVTASH